MSFKAYVWAVQQKLPGLTKLVLLMLADRHNGDTNACFPSLERVAEDCGMHRDSVKRHIKTLVDMRLVKVTKRFVNGKQTSNVYALNVQGVLCASPAETPPLGGAHSTPNQELNQEVINKGKRSFKELLNIVKGHEEAWADFVEMRKAQRKAMTVKAQRNILITLAKLEGEGQDITAVLNQSITRCYLDVFAVKEDYAQRPGANSFTTPSTKTDRTIKAHDEALALLRGSRGAASDSPVGHDDDAQRPTGLAVSRPVRTPLVEGSRSGANTPRDREAGNPPSTRRRTPAA